MAADSQDGGERGDKNKLIRGKFSTKRKVDLKNAYIRLHF